MPVAYEWKSATTSRPLRWAFLKPPALLVVADFPPVQKNGRLPGHKPDKELQILFLSNKLHTMIPKNIMHNIPKALPAELIEVIQTGDGVRIERIVSKGHASPKGFWYDQEKHEWVLVLKGGATLLLEGETGPIVLGPGDYLNIPAHTRHRVEWTDPLQETVWLAIFY